MRRAAKRDANHREVVDALRAAGVWVWDTAALGGGFPDLVCWTPWTQRFHLVEVKDGSLSPSRRKLTEDEEMFGLSCPGPVHVVTSPESALAALGMGRRSA